MQGFKSFADKTVAVRPFACHMTTSSATQDTTEKEKVQRKAEEKRFFVLLLSEMQYIRLEISKTDSLQATDKGKSQAL